MRRILFIVMILSCALLITSCSSNKEEDVSKKNTAEVSPTVTGIMANPDLTPAVINVADNPDFIVENGKIIRYIGERNVNKTLVIPEGVTSIGKQAFCMPSWDAKRNERLSICIPNNVKLDKYAFSQSVPMNVTFEEGRTEIEPYSFFACAYYNEDKMSIILPSTITTIREYSFASYLCAKIELILNEGLETISEYALVGIKCKLPSTVKVLEEGALSDIWFDSDIYDDPVLRGSTVVFPENLEVIGDYCVFIECPGEYINIPASVKEIGEAAFSFGDSAYSSGFIVDEKNKYFKSVDGWLYSKDGKRLIYAYISTGDLVIPEGVEYVGARSLNTDGNGEGGRQDIYLPSTLKTMYYYYASYNHVYILGDAPIAVGKPEDSFIFIPDNMPPYMDIKRDFVHELRSMNILKNIIFR